jgi:methionyl-tRNA synthetase
MTDTHRYFTTPIYYATGEAHVGHLYANTLLDVFRNHSHLRGRDTLALTGLDEHGEKVEESARARGKSPQALVDEYALAWKKVFADFNLPHDVFLRTTSPAHVSNVKEFLTACHANGDIYYGEHEGRYCVGCEAFLTDKEMDADGACLIHKRPTETRSEGNYYFRTSKYGPEIARRIRAGEILVQRRYVNEVLAMIESLEGDLSISRPKARTEWGVELPFDAGHVAYVWFDALSNYVTGVGGLEAARTSPLWEGVTHIIGKDILKFHAIYWPAMLLSAGLPLPRLLVHGLIQSGGHKMSKSLGNVIAPATILPYGRDAFVNHTLRAVNAGEDLDLTYRAYFERYNADLANGLGNLASRVFAMVEKSFAKTLPRVDASSLTPDELAFVARAKELPAKVAAHFEAYEQADALAAIWELISWADKYVTDSKPWDLAKACTPQSTARLGNVLGLSLATLRCVAYLAWPYFPAKMAELLTALGEDSANLKGAWSRTDDFLALKDGFVFAEVPKLFARLDVAAELARIEPAGSTGTAGDTKAAKVAKAAQTPAGEKTVKAGEGNKGHKDGGAVGLPEGCIGIDDFAKVQVRVGTVVSADLVEGSDKLLRLQVSLGELGTRQIFSGIRAWVKPEEIVNRCVLVVANLAPRKMKFGMSEGMVLSTDTADGGVCPVYVPESLKEGSQLS